MRSGHYTELFFLDEATAFAAGHRPCAHCRRDAWERFARAWCSATGASTVTPDELDRALSFERPKQRRKPASIGRSLGDLPDGAIVSADGTPKLMLASHLWTWTLDGYASPQGRGDQDVELLTPPSTVRAFASGYRPEIALPAF